MNVAEQLDILSKRLTVARWQRLNGNTWRSGTYTLRTAYVWGEATLELRHDKQAVSTLGDEYHYYRGAEPLTWVRTKAQKSLRKVLTS